MSAILSLIFNLTLLCNHPTAPFGIISYMAINTPHNLDKNLIIISLITIIFKLKKWPKRNLYGVLPLTKRYRVPYFCFLLALVIQKYFPWSPSWTLVMCSEPFATIWNLFLSSILLPCPLLNHAIVMRGGSARTAQCNQAESPSETVTLLGLYSLEPVERNLLYFFSIPTTLVALNARMLNTCHPSLRSGSSVSCL